jgi:hypothetical protein
MRDVTDFCANNRKQFIIKYDANAHHIIWGGELALVQEETGYWNICWTETGNSYMRFQVITAVSVKFRVFWDVAPCSHVQVYQRFRNAYYLHLQYTLMMEAVCTSEMSVHLNVITWLYIPEDSKL